MESDLQKRMSEIIDSKDSYALRFELSKRFANDYPDFDAGWRVYGNSLIDLARYDDAERALERAIELAKDDYRVHCFTAMGDLFRHKGITATSEHWYRKAIDVAPDDTQGYVMLGALLARRGRVVEAEAVHRRGTQCKRGCLDEAWHNLGLVLRALGRYEEAIECFEAALRIDPQYKVARVAKRDVMNAIRLIAGRE
ncbi:MAG TPA: tetratricopeptide repeat protein [Tepidisphaeraceae bacterium]|jgi:tetratricopeptide (TPR) repeat protein|nr:tetratricopeptide repeat protein [Tepidisphaeraceae bacterium]